MTAKRINITIDENTLFDLDSTATAYGMNRSEFIAFTFEALNELGALESLQAVGAQIFAEKFGREPEAARVSSSMMLKAARECSVSRD